MHSKGGRIRRFTVLIYQRGENIYFKICYEGRSLAFSTGLSCKPAELDKKNFRIKGNDSGTTYIQGLRADFQRAFTDFLLTKREPDLSQLKKLVLGKGALGQIPTLVECLERFYKDEFEALVDIEYKRKTVEKKRYLVERIKKYIADQYKNPFIKLSDVKQIDAINLTNFCKRIFKHKHNHAVLHAEFLKRTLNYAIANDWLDRNPLQYFRPKRDRKDVVALREADVKKLANEVFHSNQYSYVRDVFLFCCFSGLSYNEVQAFDNGHLETLPDGTLLIKIRRGKNNNLSIVPVVPEALAVIKKYQANPHNLKTANLLPVYANQVMNRVLKEIQAICGIEVRLTTHLARKTCASYFVENGVPLTSVATMLGHRKTSTTEQYYTQRREEAVVRDVQAFTLRKNA